LLDTSTEPWASLPRSQIRTKASDLKKEVEGY